MSQFPGCETLRQFPSRKVCAPSAPENACESWSRASSQYHTALFRPPPRRPRLVVAGHEGLTHTQVRERFERQRVDIVKFAREPDTLNQIPLKGHTAVHPCPVFRHGRRLSMAYLRARAYDSLQEADRGSQSVAAFAEPVLHNLGGHSPGQPPCVAVARITAPAIDACSGGSGSERPIF